MKSIAKLRAAGFTVCASTDAVNCTEVRSKKRFYFYNPAFTTCSQHVCERIDQANIGADGEYRLVIAGAFPGPTGEIPFEVVTEAEQGKLEQLYFELEEAQNAAQARRNALDACIAQIRSN